MKIPKVGDKVKLKDRGNRSSSGKRLEGKIVTITKIVSNYFHAKEETGSRAGIWLYEIDSSFPIEESSNEETEY